MNTGKVKFFKEEKGYGFIVDDNTGKDLFVHASKISNGRQEGSPLQKDDKVEYDIEETQRGTAAVNVNLV